MKLIWLVLAAVILAGCGAGGGGAAGNAGGPGQASADPGTQAGAASTAIVELGTQADSAATVIYGVELTLRLPAGVTLPADPASGEVSDGVLRPVDARAFAGARYLPAKDGVQASVKVIITDSGGYAVGDLATLNCAVAPGVTVSGSGFSLEGFSARDAGGVEIRGITPRFTVRTQ